MAEARASILRAAIELFARKGYAGTSTREICEAAGISKPVLYYYFRDKQHLYQELLIDTFTEGRKKLLRASKANGSLRDRLIGIIYEEFRSAREDPARIRFLLRMVLAPEQELPQFNYISEFEQEREVIAGVIQESIRKGEARGNARLLATTVMSMELFAMLEFLFTGRPTLTRRNAADLVDLLLQGCRSD